MLSGLLCWMPYSISPILISDPASSHSFPFIFSDSDKLGRVVCSGLFLLLLVGFILGAFFPFSLSLFLHDKASNFRDTLKDWCKGVLCSGLCLGSLLGCFLSIHPHTPFLFHVFPKLRICGEDLCM